MAKNDLGEAGKNKLSFEEGVDSYIPYAGPLKDNLAITVAKIKSQCVIVVQFQYQNSTKKQD